MTHKKQKIALITGTTGQDGSYLAEFLLEKGYQVHGIRRRSSSFNTQRIDHLFEDPLFQSENFFLHYGDLTDGSNLTKVISSIEPDEIYNLAAQSHVGVSFEVAEYTSDVVGLGTLRLLESIRLLKLEEKVRFYQASSSELYGEVLETPQNESTPFNPRSPYAVAKQYAFWIAKNYRESYGMFVSNGILFNHESPRRGENFVTRKITRTISNISHGLENCLYLGNLDAKRDWGHAADYVEAQWKILQHTKPDDFCIATGKQYSVREFVEWSAKEVGIELEFRGTGLKEQGVVKSITGKKCPSVKKGDVIIKIDKRYFRPLEVETLLGDPSKAQKELNWKPQISAQELCAEMMEEDYKKSKAKALLKEHGYKSSILDTE
tara:strand:- start:3711 stop:4844 length:1134 start_codon:yes stop_codon:yes gene_type:complete